MGNNFDNEKYREISSIVNGAIADLVSQTEVDENSHVLSNIAKIGNKSITYLPYMDEHDNWHDDEFIIKITEAFSADGTKEINIDDLENFNADETYLSNIFALMGNEGKVLSYMQTDSDGLFISSNDSRDGRIESSCKLVSALLNDPDTSLSQDEITTRLDDSFCTVLNACENIVTNEIKADISTNRDDVLPEYFDDINEGLGNDEIISPDLEI